MCLNQCCRIVSGYIREEDWCALVLIPSCRHDHNTLCICTINDESRNNIQRKRRCQHSTQCPPLHCSRSSFHLKGANSHSEALCVHPHTLVSMAMNGLFGHCGDQIRRSSKYRRFNESGCLQSERMNARQSVVHNAWKLPNKEIKNKVQHTA